MTADVGKLLRRLSDAGVEFIVVGGAAAVLHGAPITTEDVDIVHRRTAANVARLKAVLDDLNAHVRELANRKLPVSEAALAGEGHTLLNTSLGPLDCLGTIVEGRGFEELLSHSQTVSDEGIEFRADPGNYGISSRAARSTAMPARFALCESWTEAVLANERSCEIQGDGADVQMGDPNALQSVPQLDIMSWYGEIRLSA